MTQKGIAMELSSLRIAVVINSSSGGCDTDCSGTMAQILRGHHVALTSLDSVEGKDVTSALQKALAAKTDVLIVLGGDGTIRTAGELCSRTGTKLIPLPGGTMNMLPRALYGDGKWDDVLRRILVASKVIEVGGGEVQGTLFFCAAIFGSPALWADAREAVRKNRWLDAVRSAIRAYYRTRSRKIAYRFDRDRWAKTVALSAICPLISAKFASDERAFDMVLLDHKNAGDAATLAWNAVFSEWRKDKNVTSVRADRVRLRAGTGIAALLDGEKVNLSRVAEVRYLKHCFMAIVPASIEVR